MKLVRHIAALTVAAWSAPSLAEEPRGTRGAVTLDVAGMFALADAARDRGDFATAEAAWRAIAAHGEPEMRIEARFRLAMMLTKQRQRHAEAGVLLRQILDEKPDAARVRLELARVDALLGRLGEAERELRAAQATGLPVAVEQAVRFYAQALDARRPMGGSLSLALAPDSNVNRATASRTLATTIGDFTLNRDAQAHSGVGVLVQGQGFARLPLSSRARVLARLSASGSIYRDSGFNDLILAPQIGPEVDFARDRVSLAAGPAWRWYGMEPYTFSVAMAGNWQHTLGRRGQLRVAATWASVENRRNDLESGHAASLAAGVDRALSTRLGVGIEVSGSRQTARDPGYATASGGVSLYGWREFKGVTASLGMSWRHLEADARLALFPERRVDDDLVATLGVNFRRLRVGSVSPLVRLRYERDISTLVLYDFKRFSGEIGIATAF